MEARGSNSIYFGEWELLVYVLFWYDFYFIVYVGRISSHFYIGEKNILSCMYLDAITTIMETCTKLNLDHQTVVESCLKQKTRTIAKQKSKYIK